MKMKNNFITLIAILATQLSFAQEKKIDLNSSTIKWTGKEITTKTHYGKLKFKEGTLRLKEGVVVGGSFVVDMTSLENQDLSGGSKDYLEKHLRSEDFFGVEQHPTASLNIASAKKIKDGQQEVNGALTIKGITHPVRFNMVMTAEGATADLVFDRSKYEVKFRSASFFDDLGDKLIYDDIALQVNLRFN
jgi:polyisoprenoid-binding protein YceI